MTRMQDGFFSLLLNPAIRLLVLCSVLTGFLYPGLIMGIAHFIFPWEAEGSFLMHQGIRVGSYWIGQSFSDPRYFWGRPSDTPIMPYNALFSLGANLGPSDLTRLQNIKARIAALHSMDSRINMPVPFSLVASSGSGLDPEISASAARYQVFRVAKNRQLPIDTVARLIEDSIVHRTAFVLGESRVNVLQLNLELDRISPPSLSDKRNTNGKTP